MRCGWRARYKPSGSYEEFTVFIWVYSRLAGRVSAENSERSHTHRVRGCIDTIKRRQDLVDFFIWQVYRAGPIYEGEHLGTL
jgi:hypothetical protein